MGAQLSLCQSQAKLAKDELERTRAQLKECQDELETRQAPLSECQAQVTDASPLAIALAALATVLLVCIIVRKCLCKNVQAVAEADSPRNSSELYDVEIPTNRDQPDGVVCVTDGRFP